MKKPNTIKFNDILENKLTVKRNEKINNRNKNFEMNSQKTKTYLTPQLTNQMCGTVASVNTQFSSFFRKETIEKISDHNQKLIIDTPQSCRNVSA